MDIGGCELGRQGGIAESEFKFWFSIDKNMRGFVLETDGSEVGRQIGIAESEFKFWFSIDKNIMVLYWKLKDLR